VVCLVRFPEHADVLQGKFKAPASHAAGKCLGGLRLMFVSLPRLIARLITIYSITEHANFWTSTYPFGKLTFLKIMEVMKLPLSFLQGSSEISGSCIRSIKYDDASGVASSIGENSNSPKPRGGALLITAIYHRRRY